MLQVTLLVLPKSLRRDEGHEFDLGVKLMEIFHAKWFLECVCNLQGAMNILNPHLLGDKLLTNEMNIKLNMFCASMQNRIM